MASNACWGIEIGGGALKALKLVRDGEEVRVADFVVLPHKRVLSTPDLDQSEAIRIALGALASQYDLSKAQIAVGIPGHASFARFAKLPPVERKQVPKIVKFEAQQQVPFPLEEVEWDYQTFVSEDSPDIEVGIFAVTRERVVERLAQCGDVGLRPDVINLVPVSVYNALAHDLTFDENMPGTVIIDIGTVATDLIVAEPGRVWIRTFPLGGHNFTEALVNAFKIPYTKAEKLKREADQSKHKRHIFQAMRPVFTDLAQDIQRSMSYYQQTHPEADLKRVIGLGSTFRLLGLRKYLSQQLQIDVTRCDKFQRLGVEGPAEGDFASAALSLSPSYGLALQGLGMATIDANLVPTPVIRESVWRRKAPWFAAAAGLAVVAGAASFVRPYLDSQAAAEARQAPEVRAISDVKREGQRLQDQWREIEQSASVGATVQNVQTMLERRGLYGQVVQDVGSMLASADPQPELFTDDADQIPPGQWRLFQLRRLDIEYVTPSGGEPSLVTVGEDDARRRPAQDAGRGGGGGGALAMGGAGGGVRGGRGRAREAPRETGAPEAPYGALKFTLVTDATNEELGAFVDRTLLAWLRENAERPDAPYTFQPPSADDIVIRQVAGGPVDDAGRGRDRDAGRRGGRGRGDSEEAGGSLDELAPLPAPRPAFPDDASVYRYVIEFQATLRAPNYEPESEERQQAAAPGTGGRR